MSSHSTERLPDVPRRAGDPAPLAVNPRDSGAISNHGQADWDGVHAVVQEALESLWTKISSAVPGSFSITGRSEAPAFALFSYRVFCRSRSDEDNPICVGVTIRDQGSSYLVEGEVVGDESGRLYFDESFEAPKNSTATDFADRVDRLAARLATNDAIVLAAMAESGDSTNGDGAD